MQRIGVLVREARLRRGLTQRELARQTRVPQATISAIEAGKRSPTLDLLDRIVRGGRLPIEVRLVEEPPGSAAAFARELAERLTDPASGHDRRQDGALRSVIDLRDALLRAASDELAALVADRPAPSGDERWDAFIAGVVEEVCCRRAVVPPPWSQETVRFVKPLWYLSDSPYFRERALERTPAALLRHGVLVAEEALASV